MARHEQRVAAERLRAGARRTADAKSLPRPGPCPGPAAQLAAVHRTLRHGPVLQLRPGGAAPNRTGLPDRLKSGVEALSGIALDDVRVHYNSPKPAELQAHAYTQGSDIHVAPGQERHLPHESWHVVQQKQGRVKPTVQMKSGVPLNDDARLEREADAMGARALASSADPALTAPRQRNAASPGLVQLNGPKSSTKTTDASSALFRNLHSSAAADGASQNVGGVGGAVPFIVRVGGAAPSSTHHIFPKSHLKPAAAALSKWQAAVHAAKTAVDADKEKKVRAMSPETSQHLSALASMATGRMRKIGLGAAGQWAVPSTDYYWLNGNLFIGINSGYRTDDPGSGEEKVCPQSFPADLFQAAKAWGKYTVTMGNTLATTHGATFSYDKSYSAVEELLDTFLDMRKTLQTKAIHKTSEKVGEDWVLASSATAAQYVTNWGVPGHHYMLNKSAGNKFAALPTHQQEAARTITASVRKAMPADHFGKIRNPLRAQLAVSGDLRKEYFIASDSAEKNAVTAFAGLSKLASLMDDVRNNPDYWNLIPANDRQEADDEITKITTIRDSFKVQYGDIVAG